MFQEYIDFEIQIGALSESRYAVAVRGPGGDASGALVLPTNDPTYQALAARLERLDVDEEALAELGQVLFQALFQGAIKEVYARSQGALTPNQGLRLRLNIAPSEVAVSALPWEFLYDPDLGPLALLDAPIARYLPQSNRIPTLKTSLPLKVLLTAAQTPPALEVEQELAEVVAALADMGDYVQITVEPHLTTAKLQRLLREGFHIWHFVGHGGFGKEGRSGALHLEGASGAAEPVSAMQLGVLLNRSGLRLVVLDACESARLATDALRSIAPALVRAQVPAVVAMHFTAPEETTRAFAGEFYRALAEGFPIDACVTEGRKAVMNATGLHRADWGIPVSYTRAPDGKLFELPKAAPAASVPPPPTPTRPPETAGFVGREAKLAALAAKLATDHLVIITGMAGVGKSALAAVLARHVAAPDAIFWHTFHAGEGSDAVIWALAGFLAHNGQAGLWEQLQGARQSGGQPPPTPVLFDYLLQMLQGRRYLLCFDEVRGVDEDSAFEQFIGRLRASGVPLLITARRRPSFAQSSDVETLAGLSADEVRRLLDQRGVALAEPLIADLCVQTGGYAQFLTLAIDALRRGVDAARLIGELVAADDIERYLLSEVDATLSNEERQLMGAVAVLLDYGGSREAIEVLLEGGSARRALRALSDRHLLIANDGPEGRAYRQHAIVQAFYYDELGKRGRAALHRRAGAYYETEERDTLRAAIHYDRAGDYAHAADLATADVWALINAGQARALVQLLDRFAVRQIEPPISDDLDPERWAAVQVALGTIYPFTEARALAQPTLRDAFVSLADLPESAFVAGLRANICINMGELLRPESPQDAITWLQRGLEAVASGSMPEQAAALHIRLSSVLDVCGDFVGARHAIDQGLALLPMAVSYWHVSAAINLGVIAHHQGDFDQAIRQTQHALDLSHQLHDIYRMITILGNLGMFKAIGGDWDGAIADWQRTSELAEQLGRIAERARFEMSLGLLSMNRGDDDAALAHLTHGLAFSRIHNLRRSELGCLSILADFHVRRGESASALPLLAEAEQLIAATGLKHRLSEIYRRRVELDLALGDTPNALDHAGQALALARELGDPFDEGLSLCAQGQALHAAGQVEAALMTFAHSQALLVDDPYELARAQVQSGLALRTNDDLKQGAAMLHAARDTFARLGARRDLAQVDMLLA